MGYCIDHLPSRLSIGRETETGVTDIRIDCTDWLERWPGMTVAAIFCPPGGTPYILATEMSGASLVWHVTDADTATPGTGRMEIVGEMDGRRKVSATVKVSVAERMVGTVGEPPEAAKPWADRVVEAAERITGMKVQAETLDAGSGARAAWDGEQGLLTIGVPKGEPGKDAVMDATLTQSGKAADAKVTGDALALKLTEPSTGLAVGKYFRIAAIDESGHAVLEAVDAAQVGVQDVKAAGKSVVADGVANVPLTGINKYGIVKLTYGDSSGTTFANDTIYVVPAFNKTINDRKPENGYSSGPNNRHALVPAHLDYAVKAAMCDGKGDAWSEAEQAAARKRMCVENGADFELLVDATLEEEANTFTVVFPKPVRECIYHIWFYNNNNSSVTAQTKCLESNTTKYYLLKYTANIANDRGYALNGYFRYNGPILSRSIIGYASDSSAPSWTTDLPGNGNVAYMNYPTGMSLEKVDGFSFSLTDTSHVLNVGATIKIWGR